MIDRGHDLPITKQAEVLRISRGSIYYLPRPVDNGARPQSAFLELGCIVRAMPCCTSTTFP